jgi:hypothetical protein
MNSLGWANISACTTIGAGIRIDFVDIAFRYCFYRALINASSASCAIFTNFVSHFDYFLSVNLISHKITFIFLKQKEKNKYMLKS